MMGFEVLQTLSEHRIGDTGNFSFERVKTKGLMFIQFPENRQAPFATDQA